ncbi:DLC [Acanthosepion pharaonis]|uniref:DLC n=1 Tax=Acanthosepion pharaonis TaxID=158019 RepID=A0A812BF94_ACAPH|nr:DLC [Sepia pharaonis]
MFYSVSLCNNYGQFPIDTESVKNDHDFLDDDSFQALCRRLHILNKCCKVQIETPRKTGDDSDEDEQCALSDKWKYQRSSRRWSRMGLQVDQPCGSNRPFTVKGSSSHDSLLTDQDNYSQLEDSPTFSTNDTALTESLGQSETNSKSSVTESHTPNMPTAGHSFLSPKLSRATSFRPARNLLRRIETLRSGGSLRNKKPMDCLMISSPVITDTDNMREKIRHLNCVDLNNGQTNSHALVSRSRSAENAIRANSPVSLDNSTGSVNEDNSESYLLPSSTDSVSDYRAIPTNKVKNNSTSNLTEVYLLPPDYKPGQFPKVINNGYIETGEGHGINYRTGSFSLGRDAKRRDAESRQCANLRAENSVKRASIYDNVPTEESLEADRNELDEILQKLYDNINGFTQAVSTDDFADLEKEINVLRDLRTFDSMMGLDSGTDAFDSQQKQELELELDLDFEAASEASTHDISAEVLSDSDAETDAGKFFEPGISRERRDSGVGSSLTRAPSLKKRNRIRWTSFQKSHRPSFRSHSTQICTLSVGQFRKLQSVCMLTITTLLEKYSPASRSGWNWLVPRFIKKTKVPDYKDKKVFGVPLMETLRRTGQPLPQCILYAMRYLRKTAKDADGIFRKSGVKSRIQKLREQIEANSDLVDFSDMQAYDIADLTKQYFRELPECLLTNKLSETFIDIFTHVPKEYQLEAVNTAIILMPDENREVLQSLLLFLSDISDSADQHQMTASNLAVCFAPSLFNLVNVKSTASPSLRRNKKQQGVPDSKEILEPAHECLVFMIKNSKALFTVPQETIAKCRFTRSDLNSPRHIKDFDMNNGNPYLFVDSNTNILLKESRERFRNWIMCSPINGIDVAFKKAEDFHLLRQWMCNAEIEAPPEEVLNRLLTERYLWDEDLQECSVIEKLSEQTDILEYTRNSMPPHPARDYCLLRSWRTDLPKGACALFSTSVKHSAAKISNVEGIVMESNYLIEPCGAGKSRVTHMSREDMGGRSVRWYNLAYGHINANFMDRLRTSFQQIASGPETKL